MKTQQTKTQRARTIGAAICALLLCLGMVVMLAGLGSDEAQAETSVGSETVATVAATENRPVGWYATVTAVGTIINPDTNKAIMLVPGASGRNSAGGWVDLSSYGVRTSGGAAYIDEADLPALLSVMSFPSSPGASADSITWLQLFEVVEVPDKPVDTDPAENKNTETPFPGTEWAPTEPTPDTPPDVPQDQPTPAPAPSTDPEPQGTNVTGVSPAQPESELLSIQCRESEAEAKIAELEAQGYEIVRIEKLPKWWR